MWNWLEAWWAGKPYCERASGWRPLRKAHLEAHPCCEMCGRRDNVVPHHKLPVHLFPQFELDPENLITLCENAINCHLLAGHLGLYSSYNPNCEEDVELWHKKLEERP